MSTARKKGKRALVLYLSNLSLFFSLFLFSLFLRCRKKGFDPQHSGDGIGQGKALIRDSTKIRSLLQKEVGWCCIDVFYLYVMHVHVCMMYEYV